MSKRKKEHKKILSEIKKSLRGNEDRRDESVSIYFHILSDDRNNMIVSYNGDKQIIRKRDK